MAATKKLNIREIDQRDSSVPAEPLRGQATASSDVDQLHDLVLHLAEVSPDTTLEAMLVMTFMVIIAVLMFVMPMPVAMVVIAMMMPAMLRVHPLLVHAPALGELPGFHLGQDHAQSDLPVFLHPWTHLHHRWAFGLLAHRLDLHDGLHGNNPDALHHAPWANLRLAFTLWCLRGLQLLGKVMFWNQGAGLLEGGGPIDLIKVLQQGCMRLVTTQNLAHRGVVWTSARTLSSAVSLHEGHWSQVLKHQTHCNLWMLAHPRANLSKDAFARILVAGACGVALVLHHHHRMLHEELGPTL